MQPSPLQLQELKFLTVKIDSRERPRLHLNGETFSPYEFTNTRFETTIEHTPAEDAADSPLINFLVALRIQLPDEGETPPPYIIDVKCVGYFSLVKAAFPDPVRRYDVAVVNGASMLYGAIREMVSTITARSWYGPLLLPSSNFQADAPSNGGHHVVPEQETKTTEIVSKPIRKSKAKKLPS